MACKQLTRKKCFMLTAGVVIVLSAVVLIAYLSLHRNKNVDSSIIPGEQEPPESVRGVYANAAVASDAVPCAEVGKEMLEKNGSAVDAAIATLLCMGVYNGQSMGLGGGFFMTIYNKKSGTVEVIDARETAPAAANESMYSKGQTSFEGPLAIAVPGEIRGYELAHQKYGRLNWSELFQPAIKLARDGFKASLHMARSVKYQKRVIMKNPTLKEIYFNKATGKLKKEGDFMQLPKLAWTLEKISNDSSEMYTGEVARLLVEDIKKMGGIITMDDMKNYMAIFRNATSIKLRNNVTSYSFPPPGSGAIFNFILKVMDGMNSSEKKLDYFQEMIESFKYGYAYKSHFGDPKFTNFTELLANLTNSDMIDAIRRNITLNKTFEPEHYGLVAGIPEDYGTAHMAIVAPDGDAVSATSTVNFWFGSGLISPSTGIILNNEMDDFSFRKGVVEELPMNANHLMPGKRPLSSMCPAIFLNSTGDVVLAIGAAGGSRIISGTAMVVAKVLWQKMDLKNAIDAPRLHHQLVPNQVEYEKGIPQDILDKLQSIGHKLKERGMYGSVVVGIHRNSEDRLVANYDFRKGGSVAGY